MAYELGTASGYTDLLERLMYFISDPDRIIGDHPNMNELVAIDDGVGTGQPSQAWTIDRWTDSRNTAGAGEIEMIAHGPGSAGLDEIYVGIDTESDVGDDYYNWRLMGMTGFSDVDISLMPGMIAGRLPRMLMYTSSIKYWFIGNGRRFIVVAKVGSVYEACYLGFALPYGLPTQFPYPLVVGGAACPYATAASLRYSSTANDHRNFCNPYSYYAGVQAWSTFDGTTSNPYSTLKVIDGTSWIRIQNRTSLTSYQYENNCWPYSHWSYGSGSKLWAEELRENLDGSYPVFPIVIMIENPMKHIYGELQGCFAVPGFGGIAAEDTFTLDGDTYIAFPIVPNATRQDWWALKKE